MRLGRGPGLGLLAAAMLLSACGALYVPRDSGRIGGVAATAQGLSDAALRRLVADMDPAMLSLARRHDPGARRTDYWGRTIGWASLNIDALPSFGAPVLAWEDARRINALKPSALDAIRPVSPFVLPARGAERASAQQCLSQAVYFEAATESLEGRRAVAQTVLNRLRHPGYPKSVCGVVFEGSARATGCQFSFTCDGSLQHALIPSLWIQAQDIARQALAGYVFKDIGTATHYHADYVLPYWAPSLLKLRQIGAHIFYRWTGPAGEPRAFSGRYAGGETSISAEVLTALDERTQGRGLGDLSAALAAATPQPMPGVEGNVAVVVVPDANAPGGQRLQLTGAIGGRRIPTPEEVARINAILGTPAPNAPPLASDPAAAGTTPAGEPESPPAAAAPPQPARPPSMFGPPPGARPGTRPGSAARALSR